MESIGQSKVQTPMLRLLVLNSVCLPNSAGKMEVLLLRSCWVQARTSCVLRLEEAVSAQQYGLT
jgi:hypothetical protein